MCGLAGILRTGDRPLPRPEVLQRMAKAIAHRGPDGAGEYRDEYVQLASVRLAIVDPDGGRQPATGCGGRPVAVYNGEIYNHEHLRRELERSGHPIADRCDTSIVPHLYEAHGPAMVERLRGMFAMAIWDPVAHQLFLARDRLGIKPLFVAQTADFLFFASEAKAILASGLVPAAIDRASLEDLFSLTYPCPPRTMFKGLFELRPAHVVTVRAGERIGTPRRYWRAPFPHRGHHRRGSADELTHQVRDQLGEVVRDHLKADVPVGAYLSGGLDSSLLAALVKAERGTPPSTLTVGFTDPAFDERGEAAFTARALGGPAHTLVADEQAVLTYPEVVCALELPLQVPVGGTLLSAEARRLGLPVVLSGDGADELLGGYSVFAADKLRRLLDRPGLRALRRPLYRRLSTSLRMPDGAAEFLLEAQAPGTAAIERAFAGTYPVWHDTWHLLGVMRESLLSPDGRPVRPIGEAPDGLRALVREDVASLHPLDAALALELETRLPSSILVIGDRSSMASGVEARVPYLDHQFVELIASLPPALKMRGFREKAVLREAARGLLPERTRRRQKQPFLAPIADWFFPPRPPDFVEEALAPEAIGEAGLFDGATVATLRERLRTARPGHLLRTRLEWMLMLILGVQLLHLRLVRPARRLAEQ